ncbi:MAG: (2Fe-2S) ferredoxin domain-containing protein [Chloroflexota bacterium]
MTDSFDTSIFSKQRGRRVLICARGICAPADSAFQLEETLFELVQEHGLDSPDHPEPVTCRTVQCLGVCHSGPIMIVHPEAVRYCNVDQQALEEIVQEHLVNGNPVQKHQLPPQS